MNKLQQTLFLSIAIFGLHLSSVAHPVDLQTAQSVAAKFIGTNDLQLAATYRTESNMAALFVFNTTDGYVIVSADDCETPIVGYSNEGHFDPNNVPVQMEDYLQDFVARIQYGMENHIADDEATARQWELVKATGRLNGSKSIKAVGPLLTEKWHQGCLYNSLCPTLGRIPCGHAEVGCVAVAMGQIMHYWRYPTTGWGSNSYYHLGDVNATLSADFGNTQYDWKHMPDSLTDDSNEAEIEAVATLLFHCGVSVKTTYSFNGSGANSEDIPNALMRYFNYSRHLHREVRDDYSNEEWLSLIKSDLDLQRPVQYSGSGSGGHAFVCDGYDNNDLLHFNWGWGGPGNGYFALGNLNPIGYQFNAGNSAILNIVPQYEPWLVAATVYPPNTGTVEGTGEYHIGEPCTLTAVPSEHCDFYCWKQNGQIVTFNPTYVINDVEDDIDIEANFTLRLSEQITASYYPDANYPESTSIGLQWTVQNPNEWTLLKKFEVGEYEDGVGTDSEYIYTSCGSVYYPVKFAKYSMDGDSLDTFSIDGCDHSPALAYDGNYFYFLGINRKLHCVDFVNKTLINSTSVDAQYPFSSLCVFDPVNNGFWISYIYGNGNYYKLKMIDNSNHTIQEGPRISYIPYGSCYLAAKDGTQHLLLANGSGKFFDYDITNNLLKNHHLVDFHHSFKGACVGQYEGKEALFINYNNKFHIHKINHHLSQIIGYRLYRTDSEANTVMLADEVCGSSYIDTTWKDANKGVYRFGISSVFSNGVESEIIWSDPIVKTDYGIDENDSDQEDAEPSVQKVLEDGHIVIIKDGKKYNVSGQKLN